ncbi:MAG: hypothetical protein NVSMB21_09790 [Vulcanimicrobiaceae bacterium]
MIVIYQPVIEIATGHVARAEVLCRFPDGAQEMQNLGTFIPHAEQIGLIGELTQSVMALALTERAGWTAALPLSFNISRLDIEDATFFDRAMALLKKYEVDPATITFELNDGIQVIENGAGLEMMRRLRAAGVRLCVDGFGPTMSTFSYLELERVAVQEVKMDVLGHLSTAKRVTIASVVELAKPLRIDVVAKGVETAERLAQVGELGFGFAQGYGIAKPMEQEALLLWLAGREISGGNVPVAPPVATVEPAKRSFLGGLFGKRT